MATGAVALSLGACASSKPVVKKAPVTAAAKPAFKPVAELQAEANGAFKSGNYQGAATGYAKVLERDPNNAGTMYNRALSLQLSGQLDAAEAAYRELLAAHPGYAEAALNLGGVLKDRGKTGEAITIYQDALKKDEFNSQLLNNLSVLHRQAKDYKSSVKAIRKLLMRDKKNVDAYKNLALVYFDQKKFKLSQTILENALKMAKEQKREEPDIFVNLGMIYLAREENGRAMAAFKKAVKIAPNHVVANYNIGSLALGHRDYNLAAKSYTVVNQTWQNNYDVTVSLGYALQGQLKHNEAAATLEKAITLKAANSGAKVDVTEEEESQVYLQLMRIYQDAEKADKALEAAERYMKMKGTTCGEEDFDGFCGRYNGIKLMIQMAQEEAAAAQEAEAEEEKTKKAKSADDSSIFTEGEVDDGEGEAAEGAEGAPAEGAEGAEAAPAEGGDAAAAPAEGAKSDEAAPKAEEKKDGAAPKAEDAKAEDAKEAPKAEEKKAE